MKVVINKCFGGFSISRKAAELMAKLGSEQAKAELQENPHDWYGYGYAEGYMSYDRSDPHLIAAVERLGKEANGACAELRVVEIPDGVQYGIHEYDGMESIHEVHRSWG